MVGRSPTSPVLRAAAGRKDVVVTGPVEDVRPYYKRSAVFVVPIRMGGGVRLKILESLSMGLPVVSTTLGAEGAGLVDGKEILVADTEQDFAGAILRLIGDPALRKRLAASGRRVAEERFDWGKIAPRLLELYDEIEHHRNGARG